VAARFTLLPGRQGSVRTKTLRTVPEPAYRAITASMG